MSESSSIQSSLNIPAGEESLGKFFAFALGAHVALIAIGVLASFFFDMDFLSKEDFKKQEIIQSSVRVDVVAMPKFTVQELKKAQPELAANPPAVETAEKSPNEGVADSKSEVEFKTQKKINLSSLLGNISSKKIKKRAKKKKNAPSLSAKELNSLVMEGNKLSKGQALVGDSLNAAEGVFAEYVASIPSKVRPYWKLPSFLLEQDLRARIRIFISENGKILKTQIYESSGVEEFDRRALEALNNAGLLPVPEKSIRSRLAAGQVVLGFPL